jgi:queuine/archaeosine tRNA-ribosyltransferase
LPDEPVEFSALRRLTQIPEPPLFAFADHDLRELKTVIVKVSSAAGSVIFFKPFYPISLMKRDQILLVKNAASRFALVDQDILKLSGGFEVMMLEDEFYINDFAKFEKVFAFDKIATREMNKVTDAIMALQLVDDIKGHLAACAAPRKEIIGAGNSSVLKMKTAEILAFVTEKQPQIGLKISGDRVVLDSKESVRRLYRLLNDNYLTSGLTRVEYEILAKHRIDGLDQAKDRGPNLKH